MDSNTEALHPSVVPVGGLSESEEVVPSHVSQPETDVIGSVEKNDHEHSEGEEKPKVTETFSTRSVIGAHIALFYIRVAAAYLSLLTRYVTAEISSADYTFARYIQSTILLQFSQFWNPAQKMPQKSNQWLTLMLVSFISVGRPFFLSMASVRTTLVNIGVFTALRPVFSALLSMVLRIEKPEAVKIIAVAITVIGALIVVDVGQFTLGAGDDTFIGNMFAITNSFCVASTRVCQMFAFRTGLKPRTVSVWMATLGLPLAILLVLGDGESSDYDSLSFRAIAGLLYAGIIASSLNWFLVTWATRILKPTTTSIYDGLQPVLTSIVGVVHEGEEISLRTVSGGSLILVAMFIVIRTSWIKQKALQEEARLKKEDNLEEGRRVEKS